MATLKLSSRYATYLGRDVFITEDVAIPHYQQTPGGVYFLGIH